MQQRFSEVNGWKLVSSHRNPWGEIPLTDGGKWIQGRARDVMDRIASKVSAPDTPAKNHHYVPQTYMRAWSHDGSRVWTLNTQTRQVREIGIRHLCAEDDFYRVTNAEGEAHNKVELMFGVLDVSLSQTQSLLNGLEDPDVLEFDDLIQLGMTMAVQRMRTAQMRRLRQQHDAWLVAQGLRDESVFADSDDAHRAAGTHTQLLFDAIWPAADQMTTRQIELWDDPAGRFWTSDAPVLVPFRSGWRGALDSAPAILWPISPTRVVALTRNHTGEKAIIREADGRMRGLARKSVLEGRDRMIISSAEARDALPQRQLHRRRPQVRLRCAPHGPTGERLPPGACCIEQTESLASSPDVTVCGAHIAAPGMTSWT